MKRVLYYTVSVLLWFTLYSCSRDESNKTKSDIWDIEKDGIPEFVSTNYIELDKIYRISRYRSSIGHDYSDAFEDCRSMKHYFEPRAGVDWAQINIYSPVSGKITRLEQEWTGTKIEICSDDYPAFRFQIFHIYLTTQLELNSMVTAGDLLGKHIGIETYSDISVIVNDITRQGRMVSYFEVMTDELFAEYQSYGILNRDTLIISKTQRDANPLTCFGDVFTSIDPIECWIYLN